MTESQQATNRPSRKTLAEQTLAAIEAGSYIVDNTTFQIPTADPNVQYYAADSTLSEWNNSSPDNARTPLSTSFVVQEISTLESACHLHASLPLDGESKVGILNFASAKNPGGGFLGGAQAQEESIARSSNLYPTLLTETAQTFYQSHRKDPKQGYYSHAMIYSPDITIFRKDSGEWMNPPIQVDVLTSPAVNAGLVRRNFGKSDETEAAIAKVMKERMGRLLYLFERQGVTHLVLGSFGTGVFRNDVPTVARIWVELLVEKGARFSSSFQNVFFGVIGRKNFIEFEETWNSSTRLGHN
ncbi:hypothetical protein DL96DRAFT_1010403 [Flagelloscypha sp. PMI_526]|nr:hypothetical protein DL96DRAFT_1010403 [Flagelloscypha sp. PMI_526]